MFRRTRTRREALGLATGIIVTGFAPPGTVAGTQTELNSGEVSLRDEASRSFYGNYDVRNFGPVAQRVVRANFEFPADVDVALGYGIDISHYTEEIPWAVLASKKVNYVYVKASQSRNGRDDKFVEFWSAAKQFSVPCGAYHFLTAGVHGHDQALYFLKRLSEVGGLQRGNLQPVIDLEWDVCGPNFKRVVLGRNTAGDIIYKDYWDDFKPMIVETINQCVSAIRSGTQPLTVKPIIYTNRSWWETHIPPGTVFTGCTIWISDYRAESYKNNSPRSVPGHEYHLWQFTDKAHINVEGELHGPYDSNKLLFGGISVLQIT